MATQQVQVNGLNVTVLGAPSARFRDYYHRFLRLSWPRAMGAIVALYLAANAVFAVAYVLLGGIGNARPHNLADAFFFSVQTMGTIGYGAMYPQSLAANVLVVAESVVGLIMTALATGLVFSKFSQSSARIVFTRQATIAPMDGVPTLSFRLGNERGNHIVEATMKVVMIRTERTREGSTFYRMIDLPLSRERSPAFTRSWTALHPIVPGSPLHGLTPDDLKAQEIELLATVVGTDDTSLQPVHARQQYTDDQIVWGARHRDILHEQPDGSFVINLHEFHELAPAEPIEGFPYRWGSVARREDAEGDKHLDGNADQALARDDS